MIQLDYYKNKNAKSPLFGKVYGRVKNKEPFTIKQLAEHISTHDSIYGYSTVVGVLAEVSKCIKELCLDGQPVKLDDLAIFRAAVTSKPADDIDEYTIQKNIKAVRIKVTGTGETSNKNMIRKASLGWTSLSQRIQRKEIVLSDVKGEYIVGGNDEIDDVQP